MVTVAASLIRLPRLTPLPSGKVWCSVLTFGIAINDDLESADRTGDQFHLIFGYRTRGNQLLPRTEGLQFENSAATIFDTNFHRLSPSLSPDCRALNMVSRIR